MIMKKALIIAALALTAAACTPKGEYRIHGYVTEAELNGVQIFLVPLHDQSPQMVDSVYIADNKFEFKGHGKMRSEWMAELRVDKMHRYGIEDLLVVTEPGDIYVTIGRKSSAYGTPQNDSLQVWKNLNDGPRKNSYGMRRIGQTEVADSLMRLYNRRSRELALHLDGTTLGAWLQQMYPIKK